MELTAPQGARRPFGLRLIIGYKLVKAVVVLALALWLTLSSGAAYREARHLIALLNEHPGWLHKMAQWLDAHVTTSAVHAARIVTWLDGLVTILEASLLITGKAWGEWLVVAGVASLLPLEARAVWLHPHPSRILVLFANLLIVIYLVWHRLHHDKPVRSLQPQGVNLPASRV